MANNKTYVRGIAKEIGNYGNLSISLDVKQLQQHMDSKGFVKVVVTRRREVGNYGETHSVYLDTYQKSQAKGETDEKDLPW